MSEIIPFAKLPAAPDVEGRLLGALLAIPEKIELVEGSGLVRDDFQNRHVGIAWDIAKSLITRRLHASAETVCSAAVRSNWLTLIDMMWLADLEVQNKLALAGALQIADDVRALARGRSIRLDLQQQIDLIDRGRFSPSHLHGALEGILHALSTEFSGDETADADLLELNVQWASNVEKGQSMLRPTGIRVLDQALGGGVPRNLWIVQGKPGSGKNALFTSMIRAKLLADPECKIGVFGLESGTAWLTRRWQAEDLGLKQSEVGSKPLTTEQWERKAVVDNSHAQLLKRVMVYRHDGVSATELARRAMRWIFKFGITDLLIDNLREVKPDPRSRQEYHLQISETIRVFRNIGSRYGVSTGLAVHDVDDGSSKVEVGKEKPPHPDKMQGGKDPGARARAVIGLWRKGYAYRATITKNEMGEARWPDGPTCEFKFDPDSATFHPEAGQVVDLREEERKEKREQRDDRLEMSAEDTLRRNAIIARKKAAAAKDDPPAEEKAPDPQATLLDVPASTKPEAK